MQESKEPKLNLISNETQKENVSTCSILLQFFISRVAGHSEISVVQCFRPLPFISSSMLYPGVDTYPSSSFSVG